MLREGVEHMDVRMKAKFLLCFFLLSGFFLMAESIHDAAREGNLAQIRKLAEGNPKAVNLQDKNKMTPLHHAIDNGKCEAASVLIEMGAGINASNFKSETPLHIAAYKGNADAVKLLLKHGADVTLREMRDRIPLFLACNWGHDLETVRLLIQAGSDVNFRNKRGEILLVSSLYYGKKEIIDLLIDKGATIPDDENILRRVLFVTASNGMDRPFNIAMKKSEKKKMKWWTGIPMHACARGGSVAIAEKLMAKGVDFKSKNKYGLTPLHIAAGSGRTELVKFLIKKGTDVNCSSFAGKTPFHYALENGHKELALLLVRAGARQELPEFPVLKGDYLGQTAPGDTPKLFAPGIVSAYGFDSEHSPAVFSPDLSEVYWTHKFRGPVLFMRQINGKWTTPEPAFFNTEYGEGEPIFSPDGKKLFFLSMRPVKEGGKGGKENLWYIIRKKEHWTEPKPVSPLINDFDLHWLFSVSDSGTIYFSSPSGKGFGKNDIFKSRLVQGEYQEPENLGDVINTGGIEHTPFIAPDESYLIYVSSRGSPSFSDIKFYISYRKSSGSWTSPVSLGPKINSVQYALCPAVTPDKKFMFFIGGGDIYWVSATFIEDLKLKDVKK